MSERILLVEDEVAVRNVYQLYLEQYGYSVQGVSFISESLRVLKEDRFDLVIIDIFLGEENGLDLMRGIVAARPKLPVLIMSGIGYEEPYFEEALNSGAAGFFSKTLPLSQLLMEVRRLLRASKVTKSVAQTVSGERARGM